jgi:hypothetical protein
MKGHTFVILFILFASKIYSFDTFFCTDGPLRIRDSPNLSSAQIGSLNLFDKATILEKIENKITIDNINDYWYKINFKGLNGYIFGGYGIVLKDIYEIKGIDDFFKLIPDKTSIKLSNRYLFTGKYDGEIPMVQLDYVLKFVSLHFNLTIYMRPKQVLDIQTFAQKYNLEINQSGNYFGRGDSYKSLKNIEMSNEIITKYGNKGRYFFSDWASGTSRDIGTFLFEINFSNDFNGIIIQGLNMWTNYNDENISNINNQYIIEARKNRIKESIIYQILYETILRTKIVE